MHIPFLKIIRYFFIFIFLTFIFEILLWNILIFLSNKVPLLKFSRFKYRIKDFYSNHEAFTINTLLIFPLMLSFLICCNPQEFTLITSLFSCCGIFNFVYTHLSKVQVEPSNKR